MEAHAPSGSPGSPHFPEPFRDGLRRASHAGRLRARDRVSLGEVDRFYLIHLQGAQERLTRSLRWTLFEQPGELVCQMNPILEIATGDGAEVRVKGRGYGKREHLSDQRWRVAAIEAGRIVFADLLKEP